MAICGIYKITNDVNGHAYIGQAVDVFVRWRQHFNEAYNPESNAYDGYFYRAVRKYGVENFSMKVLEVCKPEELNDREIFYIKKFGTYRNNGYNMTIGGQDFSCTTARAIDQYDLNGNLICTYTSIAEAKRQTGVCHIDRVLSGESRTSGGFYWSYCGNGFNLRGEKKSREKQVNQYTLDGVFVRSYASITDAQRETELTGISNACRNKVRCGMYLWTFDGEEPIPYKVRNRKY